MLRNDGLKKYIVEFIGTFFLVLTIVCTVNAGLEMAPLIIGFILSALIYGGFHVSGAHYNPAVTIAVLMRGKIDRTHVPGYFISQLAGGLMAAYIGSGILDMTPELAPVNMKMLPGIVAEVLGTFVLCFVILSTATTKEAKGNSYYGLAIGFTVIAITWALGMWSGGVFNPAVGFGLLIANMTTGINLTAIIIANFVGAVVAAVIFRITFNSHSKGE